MTLTEFLLARIDDNEALARWRPVYAKWGIINGSTPPLDRAHVLLECKAKRRILALHAAAPDGCDRCLGHADYTGDVEMEPYPCQTLRYLAAVYADHPDYDDEWAPHEA